MDLPDALERPAVRWTLLAVGGLLLLHLVAWVSLLGLQRSHTDAVLAGVEVDAVAVGGMDRAGLVAAVEDRATQRLAQPVRVVTSATTDTDEPLAALQDARAALGQRADTPTAVEEAWAKGRRGLWRALADQLRVRTGDTLHVILPVHIDGDELEAWASTAALELSIPPRDGAIALSGDDGDVDIEVTDARHGTEVEAAEVREQVREATIRSVGPVRVEVAAEQLEPDITQVDVDAALADTELAVSAAVELDHPSAAAEDLVLAPTDLAEVLHVIADREAAEGARLQVTTDPDRLADHLGEEQLEALSPERVEASLALVDGAVERTESTRGFELDLAATTATVLDLASQDADRSAELPGEIFEPEITTEDVEAVAGEAEVLVSAPVTLTNPSAADDLELSPTALSEVLDVEVVVDDDGPSLRVGSSADRLTGWLGEDGVAALERSPAPADANVVGGQLVVDGGTPGFSVDTDATAEVVVDRARDPDDRSAELPGDTTHADVSPQTYEDLGITEVVSQFTTDLTPGQSRNTNIRLAADHIDGDRILPGESYSLNQGIGQRTAARGFVANGFIQDGELISVTGGGVSQMGTTFFNAAWFAGIRIDEFHPHSLYFARYPEGREATLSWGTLDVVVHNDSPYAIEIFTSHSSSHVTVYFASTSWAAVDTWTGERYDLVEGDERDGFTVDFGREITYPDGSTTSESYSHTYRPANGD